MKTVLLEIILFIGALIFFFLISKWFQTWIIRREIKRLKSNFAKLQQAFYKRNK